MTCLAKTLSEVLVARLVLSGICVRVRCLMEEECGERRT